MKLKLDKKNFRAIIIGVGSQAPRRQPKGGRVDPNGSRSKITAERALNVRSKLWKSAKTKHSTFTESEKQQTKIITA